MDESVEIHGILKYEPTDLISNTNSNYPFTGTPR